MERIIQFIGWRATVIIMFAVHHSPSPLTKWENGQSVVNFYLQSHKLVYFVACVNISKHLNMMKACFLHFTFDLVLLSTWKLNILGKRYIMLYRTDWLLALFLLNFLKFLRFSFSLKVEPPLRSIKLNGETHNI